MLSLSRFRNSIALTALTCLPLTSALVAPVQAQSIAIQNASFEAIQNTPGNYTNPADIPDWSITGLVATYNPGSTINVPVPDGTEVAAVGHFSFASIAQQLTTSLVAGDSYTLTVEVGQRNDNPGSGASVSLFAGGSLIGGSNTGGTLLGSTVVNPPVGGFTTAVVNYTAPLFGGPTGLLSIVLANPSPNSFQVEFDNVQLNRVSANVPEPGAIALLMGTGVSGTLLMRRRQKQKQTQTISRDTGV